MGDILTQIQDHLDLLLSMMSKDLEDIRIEAPPLVPPGQQRLDSFAEREARTTTTTTTAENTQGEDSTNPSQPSQHPPADTTTTTTSATHTPEEFEQKIKDMAIDITKKASQIELLIASLPGLHSSEKEQVVRMKDLERELEELEEERVRAVKEKARLVRMVEDKIMSIGNT